MKLQMSVESQLNIMVEPFLIFFQLLIQRERFQVQESNSLVSTLSQHQMEPSCKQCTGPSKCQDSKVYNLIISMSHFKTHVEINLACACKKKMLFHIIFCSSSDQSGVFAILISSLCNGWKPIRGSVWR